jgi:hypothetical protein
MVTDPPYGVNRDTDALTLASIAMELNQRGIRSAAAVNGTSAPTTSVKPFYRECAWVTRCGPRNRAQRGRHCKTVDLRSPQASNVADVFEQVLA